MKSAEEYLNNSGLASEYGYNVEVVPVSIAINAMKIYANQKLDEAKLLMPDFDHVNKNLLDSLKDQI